jgi:hypothetical protein
MLSTIIIRILVVVICAAIGRGIVFAFGLDAKVARTIQRLLQTASDFPEARNAIAWSIAGLIGLACLLLWLIFHVDEKLYDALSPRPALGSLPFVSPFMAEFARNIGSGETDVLLPGHVEISRVARDEFPIRVA